MEAAFVTEALAFSLGGPEIVILLIVLGLPLVIAFFIVMIVISRKKKDE